MSEIVEWKERQREEAKRQLMTDDRIPEYERVDLRDEAQACVKEYETTWCAC